jgi:excinuclease UvrABC nuclease subunit
MNLFPPEPFLEQRLGAEAFQHIPDLPGIYRFYDLDGRLLYVGKSINLRRRLFGYKRARAGSVSRKVSEMISRVHRFELEITSTEEAALLLENRLIREFRPPYNHANKETETYYFVYVKPTKHGIEFRLSMKIHHETDPAYWYGCFKGHAPVRRSAGALLQLLWMSENNVVSPVKLPVQLTRNLTPVCYMLWFNAGFERSGDLLSGLLNGYLSGATSELLNYLTVRIEGGLIHPFSKTGSKS